MKDPFMIKLNIYSPIVIFIIKLLGREALMNGRKIRLWLYRRLYTGHKWMMGYTKASVPALLAAVWRYQCLMRR